VHEVKTTELINSLVVDERTDLRPSRALWRLVLAPIVVSALLLLAVAGVRPDLEAVATTPRFLFKLVVTLAFAVTACGTLLRLARPEGRAGGWAIALLFAGGLLLSGMAIELLSVPRSDWGERLKGENANWCLRMIPMLSALPLISIVLALRNSAPKNAGRAGAVAGLFAAAVGASLYALHCTDDSPLFLATWYGLAAVCVSAVGSLLGSRLLRW
jgi:hypothetical protein